MRYFDLIETPLTGKTFLEGGESRLPATDSKVAVYFQPVDDVKYDRSFDTDGYPVLKEYELQEDGTRYQAYLTEPDEDGVYQPDLTKIQEITTTNTMNTMSVAIQKYMDDTAQTRKYDNIMSLCTYATDLVEKYRLEGQAGVEFRSACWSYGEKVVEDVMNGVRTIPTEEELLSELPIINW